MRMSLACKKSRKTLDTSKRLHRNETKSTGSVGKGLDSQLCHYQELTRECEHSKIPQEVYIHNIWEYHTYYATQLNFSLNFWYAKIVTKSNIELLLYILHTQVQ